MFIFIQIFGIEWYFKLATGQAALDLTRRGSLVTVPVYYACLAKEGLTDSALTGIKTHKRDSLAILAHNHVIIFLQVLVSG